LVPHNDYENHAVCWPALCFWWAIIQLGENVLVTMSMLVGFLVYASAHAISLREPYACKIV